MDNASTEKKVTSEPCKKDGLDTIRLTKDGRSVYLHSRYDPVGEAERLTEKLELGADTVYFIFGLGAGYHVRALASRMGAENKIIVFEPDDEVYELFFKNSYNRDILDDERITIEKYVSVYHVNAVLGPFYNNTVSNIRNRIFALPIYKDIYNKEYEGFISCIKSKAEGAKLISNTHDRFSDVWFRCLINNMRFLPRSHSGKPLANMFEGVPAIIVSAGPSLAKNIALLEEAVGRAVIISVDTAYKPLYNRKIMPDFVVTVDSGGAVAAKFRGIELPAADLAAPYLSSTEVLNTHKGRIIALSTFHVFLDECYEDLGIELLPVATGGSVACSALDFACKLGAEPIVFIGQDLAFTNDETHIAGTAYYSNAPVNGQNKIYVSDIYGNTLQTDYRLNNYRIWIEQYIAENSGRTYIDATEGGAKIDGTIIMTLREALDKYCQKCYDVSEIKERIFVSENKSVTNEQYEGFIGHFEKSCKYLNRIVSEVDACIATIEKIIREINANGFRRPDRIAAPFEKVKRLNKSLEINEHYVDIILALMAKTRDETTTTEHLSGRTPEQALAGDLEKQLNYFKALSKNIKYAVPLIEDAAQKEKEYMEGLKNG